MDNKNETHHRLPEDDERKDVNDVDRENEEALAEVSSNDTMDLSHEDANSTEQEKKDDMQEIQEQKAGFWIRFCAYIIDVIVVSSINAIALSPVVFFSDASIFEFEYISVIGILSGIVYYMYFLFMTRIFSQTLGKMIMGIRVISTEQEKASWGDLLFREVIGRFIHNVFFILKFLYLVVAFTDEKKGVHDIIGNTRVVYAKS